jgi:hypothetical protein
MKKMLFSLLLISTVMVSCSKDDAAPSCATSVSGIAGSFKITKLELVTNGVPSDITLGLTSCELSGIYRLNADKTATYTEAGSSCTDSWSGGSWDVVSNKLIIKDDTNSEWYNASITSWNCSNLLISESGTIGSQTVNYVTTFTKQ